MSNRKFTTARAAAFWFALFLHLALGTALYYNISDTSTAHNGRAKHESPANSTFAKP